jgi:hypothetical protein
MYRSLANIVNILIETFNPLYAFPEGWNTFSFHMLMVTSQLILCDEKQRCVQIIYYVSTSYIKTFSIADNKSLT